MPDKIVCEICFEEGYSKANIEAAVLTGGQLPGDQIKFVKLEACEHQFCELCFEEIFKSMIEEQNKHDQLTCP